VSSTPGDPFGVICGAAGRVGGGSACLCMILLDLSLSDGKAMRLERSLNRQLVKERREH
jgi:hypothetical protein